MGEIRTATLFEHDGAVAVDLPKGFPLAGGQVRITPQGRGVLIEPVETVAEPDEINADPDELERWLKEIHTLTGGEFMLEGRQQPPLPPSDDLTDCAAARYERVDCTPEWPSAERRRATEARAAGGRFRCHDLGRRL